jgi:hypothetical protein
MNTATFQKTLFREGEMKKVLLLLCFMAGISNASSVDPTKITKILVGPYYGNKVFLVLSNKPSDTATCNTNSRYTYVFDGTTPSGKMTLSLALAAYAAQKDVWLGGNGTCTIYGDVENLSHIVTK